MDDELKAVYDRIFARELLAREEIRQAISCLHIAEIVRLNFGQVEMPEIERWRDEGRIFSLGEPYRDCYPRFQFDGGQPKPIIRQILKLLEPKDEWHAAFWFFGANGWLEIGEPYLMVDSDPEQVLLAAQHANDVVSD